MMHIINVRQLFIEIQNNNIYKSNWEIRF